MVIFMRGIKALITTGIVSLLGITSAKASDYKIGLSGMTSEWNPFVERLALYGEKNIRETNTTIYGDFLLPLRFFVGNILSLFDESYARDTYQVFGLRAGIIQKVKTSEKVKEQRVPDEFDRQHLITLRLGKDTRPIEKVKHKLNLGIGAEYQYTSLINSDDNERSYPAVFMRLEDIVSKIKKGKFKEEGSAYIDLGMKYDKEMKTMIRIGGEVYFN